MFNVGLVNMRNCRTTKITDLKLNMSFPQCGKNCGKMRKKLNLLLRFQRAGFQPNEVSRSIMTKKPDITDKVPKSLCSPKRASGISSSTTT